MYFFTFDTTTSMSRSTMSLRWTPLVLGEAVVVADGAGSLANRRVGTTGGGAPLIGGGRVTVEAAPGPGGDALTIAGADTGPVGDDFIIEDTAAGEPAGGGREIGAMEVSGRGGVAAGRAGSGGWLLSSRSHATRVGAIRSSAHASRWRRVATWLSQQATEQNTRRIRVRLQVETLHW